ESLGHRADVELARDAERFASLGRVGLFHLYRVVSRDEYDTCETTVGLRSGHCFKTDGWLCLDRYRRRHKYSDCEDSPVHSALTLASSLRLHRERHSPR